MNKVKITLYALTFAWLLLATATFTVFNPPQCPDYYTQAQVDATGCNVGANIGTGVILVVVIMPFTAVLIVAWLVAYLAHRRKKK